MKLLEVQSSLASRFLSLIHSNIPHPKSMNMKPQVLHLYKTTGKFIAFDVLITQVNIRYSAVVFSP
jgi:hypothetical protein